MLRNTLRHLIFIARQLGEYFLMVSIVIILGSAFALVNFSSSNHSLVYENIKIYSFMGLTLISFIFFNANALYNHVLIQYNLTRRSLFLGSQIGKVVISISFVLIYELVLLFVNMAQKTPYSINSLFENLPNMALFILMLSVGEIAGQLTLRLGKFGIILYSLCFGIIGGFVGFFAVSNPAVITKLGEFMISSSSTHIVLPLIYLAGAAILTTGSYLMHRKVSV